MRTALLSILILPLSLAVDAANACRPEFADPLSALESPDWNTQFGIILVGEIVGVRNPGRVDELNAWLRASEHNFGQEGDQLLLPVKAFGPTYEVEIYPTEKLRGSPNAPHNALVRACHDLDPHLQDRVILFESETGSSHMIYLERDAGRNAFEVDADYLARVRACAANSCPAGK